jgi:hypothetical protein
VPGATHVPVLAVSVSGSDAFHRRPERWRAVIDDVVMAHVRIVFAERFFATVEFALVMTHDWHTREDAQRAIFRYIETWDNRKRRHSTLGYVSPAEYDAQVLKAA